MKNILTKSLLVLGLVFCTTNVVAPVEQVDSTAKAQYSFTCYAQSGSGQSHYTHPNREFAVRRAIRICQANTSPYDYCEFIGCTPW
jgi:hypothetical protein